MRLNYMCNTSTLYVSLQYLFWFRRKQLKKTVSLVFLLRHTHPDPSDQLCRSHMTQYRWGYCKWEYHWGYIEGTLQLLHQLAVASVVLRHSRSGVVWMCRSLWGHILKSEVHIFVFRCGTCSIFHRWQKIGRPKIKRLISHDDWKLYHTTKKK